MKDFSLAGELSFRQMFYTPAMMYDRREQQPFPPINVYYCCNRILVQALIPGLDSQDVQITLDQNNLILEGFIKRNHGHYVYEERFSGHFQRRIPLDINKNFSQREVTINDGILQIEFKKRI